MSNQNGYTDKKNMNVAEAEAVRNLAANIRTLMKTNNISTQKELARNIRVPEATLSTFLKKAESDSGEVKLPAVYPFIANLSNYSGITLDLLLNTRVDFDEGYGKNDTLMLDLSSLRGIYYFYYLDSSPYVGHEYEIDSRSLRFGLLLIYYDYEDAEHHALLLAGLTRKEMTDTISRYKDRFTLASTFKAGKAHDDLKDHLHEFRGVRIFEGIISSLDKDFVLFDMNCTSVSKDHLTMIFYYQSLNPNSYIGGLGEGLSISRGNESTPCAQLFGTSKYELDVSNEQIVQSLLLPLACPDLSLADEETLRALVRKLSAYYSQSRNAENSIVGDHLDAMFSEDDIRILIASNLRKILIDMVTRNHQRSFKITEIDDNRWYHLIKSCIRNEV